MTPEDYKRLESAARAVCKARNQNPDDQVEQERASWESISCDVLYYTCDVLYYAKRWENVARELWDFEIKHQALHESRMNNLKSKLNIE